MDSVFCVSFVREQEATGERDGEVLPLSVAGSLELVTSTDFRIHERNDLDSKSSLLVIQTSLESAVKLRAPEREALNSVEVFEQEQWNNSRLG